MFDNRGSSLKIRFLKPGEYHEFKSCTLVCMPNLKFKSWKLHTVHIIARQSSWNSGYMTACANLKNPSKWVSLYPNLGYNDHTHAQRNIFILTWISDISFHFNSDKHYIQTNWYVPHSHACSTVNTADLPFKSSRTITFHRLQISKDFHYKFTV